MVFQLVKSGDFVANLLFKAKSKHGHKEEEQYRS